MKIISWIAVTVFLVFILAVILAPYLKIRRYIRQQRKILMDWFTSVIDRFENRNYQLDRTLEKLGAKPILSPEIRYLERVFKLFLTSEAHINIAGESLTVIAVGYPPDYQMHIATIEEQLERAEEALNEIDAAMQEYQQLYPHSSEYNGRSG